MTFDKDTGLLLHAKEQYLNSNSSDYSMWFNHTIERTLILKSTDINTEENPNDFSWIFIMAIIVFASISLIALYLVCVRKDFHRERKKRSELEHSPKRRLEKT
ncbi:MAG: hypothetical protein R6U96_16070 [Promethearchaeia archaeon]